MIGLYPIGSGSSLPSYISDDKLIPPSFNSEDEEKLFEKLDNNYALPGGFYPYPIHTLGDYDHILNPPCPGKD